MPTLKAVKTIISADKKGIKSTIVAGETFETTQQEAKILIDKCAAEEFIAVAEKDAEDPS